MIHFIAIPATLFFGAMLGMLVMALCRAGRDN